VLSLDSFRLTSERLLPTLISSWLEGESFSTAPLMISLLKLLGPLLMKFFNLNYEVKVLEK
jgi:hypothetical protein